MSKLRPNNDLDDASDASDDDSYNGSFEEEVEESEDEVCIIYIMFKIIFCLLYDSHSHYDISPLLY